MKKVYICGTDFDHELGETTTKVYKSVEACKDANPCWQECGIIEIIIKNYKTVEPAIPYIDRGRLLQSDSN